MNEAEFKKQIKRLVDTYGTTIYGIERVKMLWAAFKHKTDQWFVEAVDHFISNEKYAPLVADFRDHAAKNREREWEKQKERNAAEARDVMAGRTFSDDEQRHFFDMTRRRAEGLVSDQDWESFLKVMKGSLKYGDT